MHKAADQDGLASCKFPCIYRDADKLECERSGKMRDQSVNRQIICREVRDKQPAKRELFYAWQRGGWKHFTLVTIRPTNALAASRRTRTYAPSNASHVALRLSTLSDRERERLSRHERP